VEYSNHLLISLSLSLTAYLLQLPLRTHLQHLVNFIGPHRHLLAVVACAPQLIQCVQVLILVRHRQLLEVPSTLSIIDPLDLRHLKNALPHNLIQSSQNFF
jgi:hypothetical protein